MFEGDPDKRWRDCHVIDISSGGAGLELSATTAEQINGRRIILALELKAEVRHGRVTPDKRLRVGVQFVELTDGERTDFESLAELDGRWQ
jgi:hypothetical protein